MPELSTPVCLFCGGADAGCPHCAPVNKWLAKRAERKTPRPAAGYKPQKPPASSSPDCCEKCLRVPGDPAAPKCCFCPPDPEGPRLCVRGCGRPANGGGYHLCRRCYKEMDPAERAALPPRKMRPAPRHWLTDRPAERPEPTNFRPGSPEKVAVMTRRAELRQTTDHPGDAGAKALTEADFQSAFVEMMLRHFAPHGIHKAKGRWRARPWWGYERFHLGYFRYREDAITAVREWKDLAKEEGPKEAMLFVRAKWAKRRREAA